MVDNVVTSETHDRYELMAVGLDEVNYYIVAYQECYPYDGSCVNIIFGEMAKDTACLRRAIGDIWHYDLVKVYKFGILYEVKGCLYL